ncbi:YciI family protein [Bradyrhizobium sp. LjRoot220]|uniref:YciI family protein n=1 Tax=Bradyrhizobium sp. LjRoot220 TaxID=3342284 RepID=UPI003F508832
MRVMVFGRAGSDTSAPPTQEAFAAMDRFTEELVKAGIMVAGAGLQNNAEAKRITSDGSNSTVIDGPFAETSELVARIHDLAGEGYGRGGGLGRSAIRCWAQAGSRSVRSTRQRIWPSI